MIEGISYSRIKHITDWMLTEETQRRALAQVVNAVSRLDITQAWGEGRTSSSDGQRFAMNRRVLQQTYSPKFNDYALEFYSFVADNYAPFYSLPIECTDRDAAMSWTDCFIMRAIYRWMSILLIRTVLLKIILLPLPCWVVNFLHGSGDFINNGYIG